MRFVLLAPLFLLFQNVNYAQSGYDFVNPFIGTKEMGHTFPGACFPFGFVQLSPDTDTIPYEMNGAYNPQVYRYCSGYQYEDKTIVGFSHTHFSGTGHSDLGDILIMPSVGRVRFNPGTADHPESGYRSRFRHETEQAKPGYYAVHLDDPDIYAEMTVTPHCGFHQYTFPASDSSHIILDLLHGIYNYEGKVLWAVVSIVNDTMIKGYRITSGWARTRYIYFVMTFSKPFHSFGFRNEEKGIYKGFWRKFDLEHDFPEIGGRKIKACFQFHTSVGEQIRIKVGLSAVSTEGALKNLNREIPHWGFDRTRKETETRWRNELDRIQIDASADRKTNFYTAFYHTLLSPVIYQDVDGYYRGIDHQIHRAEGFTNYTIFSLWDTYRALHPFLVLMYPQLTSDIINSLLAHQDQSPEGMLPVWSHHGNENWCMIGYHGVSVISDAWVKGIRGFDAEDALKACIATADNKWYEGVNEYRKYGYVPAEKSANSASVTLEYAYDDYALSRFAESLSNSANIPELVRILARKEMTRFQLRSLNFRNIWDNSLSFMRAKKLDGTWVSPFDPLSTHGHGFIEGNSWNYSFYVPHDIPGLIRLMGGTENFVHRLDTLFAMHLDDHYFGETEDVTRIGLIGNYVHGNEPSHHIPYLYNWTDEAWKTQERVNHIVQTMYKNAPDGLCGNDDCGQMSAWYIFSVIGFYPVCPGNPEYATGLPGAERITLDLPGGKSLKIVAKDLNDQKRYVKMILFNGRELNTPFVDHGDVSAGGILEFEMTSVHP